MTEEQIEEAAAAAMVSVGASTFLHGTMYSTEKFKQELDQAVQHIKGQVAAPV